MHILVTNDDGPPSAVASPYILPFVQALERAGHTVSVIVPDGQRSWIGKAYLIGEDVRVTHYWPPRETPEAHSAAASSPPSPDEGGTGSGDRYPWVLTSSTPATCAQLGLHHFFQDRGPVDLVVSGPNFGRNSTALFALSSGTLGAALEAAVCGARAVALSFAFRDRRSPAALVAECCAHSVRVCAWLARHAPWGEGRLYSVNVPVRAGVAEAPVVWTRVLQNQWPPLPQFKELHPAATTRDPAAEEGGLRRGEDADGAAAPSRAAAAVAVATTPRVWEDRHFKWAPDFVNLLDEMKKGGPGTDGWAVHEGQTSISALRANFMHAEGLEGEVKL